MFLCILIDKIAKIGWMVGVSCHFHFVTADKTWTWPFWKMADCCCIAGMYTLPRVLLYQLNSWSLSYRLRSLYPGNSTEVVFLRRLIVDLVATKILRNRSYYKKKPYQSDSW